MLHLCQALASNPRLVLPSSLYREHTPTGEEAAEHLHGLAQRDPSAFLQRYGNLLDISELSLFAHLRSDYEVNHWLVHFGLPAPPTPQLIPSDQATAPMQQATTTTTTEPMQGTSGPMHGAPGPMQATSGPMHGAPEPMQAATGPMQATDGPMQATTGPLQATTGPMHGSTATPSATRHAAGRAGGSSSVHLRNRRLAAMQRLQAQGEFFEMEAMRGRAPLLYHQMIGHYMGDDNPAPPDDPGADQAPGPAVRGPGRFSEMLMAQHDRAMEAVQMRQEMEEENEQMSEHDSDDEEDEEEGEEDMQLVQGNGTTNGTHQGGVQGGGRAVQGGPGGGGGGGRRLSTAALVQKRREFVQEMEQRFLFGQDVGHVDYPSIDQDTELDDHWAVQAGRDAEDRYFEDAGEEEEEEEEQGEGEGAERRIGTGRATGAGVANGAGGGAAVGQAAQDGAAAQAGRDLDDEYDY